MSCCHSDSVDGAQGYVRAFHGELIPRREEARWYGLFPIMDKSSSFHGPLVVGVIGDLTGNIRYAFLFSDYNDLDCCVYSLECGCREGKD